MSGLRFTRNDGLLLLMTVIWGANYSIVKVALRAIPPLAFNSLRLGFASLLFLLTIALCRRPADAGDSGDATRLAGPARYPADRGAAGDVGLHEVPAVFHRTRISARDWALIAVFGLVGHFVYQLCFVLGLDRTTAANSSLILGCSPVVVALFSAAVGNERVGPAHWAGAVLSVAGIYLVVGRGAHIGGASLAGDVLTICGLFCWGAYTVGAKGLLDRHSPLEVTGYSMAIGTAPFVLTGIPHLIALDWNKVPGQAWVALVFSAIFALFVAYLIWYVAVQRIGNIRTAMYSNVTPVAALAFAVLWLGEHLQIEEIIGAGAILTGMALTRLTSGSPARSAAPAEE